MESVQRWERRTELPLAAVAVVFLIAYAWPILDVHLAHDIRVACHSVSFATWVIFAADYAVRISLARPRVRYFWRHLPDLAVVALPLLRPLRLLRLLMLLRVMNRAATKSLRGRVAVYVGSAASLLIFCAALAELDAERFAPGANIRSFGNSLWWAATTVTTVGYGDHYPVTVAGRLVAIGLMVGGVALIGVVTASVASWLIDRVRQVDEDTAPDVSAVLEELRQLREQVARLAPDGPAASGPTPATIDLG